MFCVCLWACGEGKSRQKREHCNKRELRHGGIVPLNICALSTCAGHIPLAIVGEVAQNGRLIGLGSERVSKKNETRVHCAAVVHQRTFLGGNL